MNRRGFLGAMLGVMAAPAVVKAENLMKIFVPPEKKILTLGLLAGDFDGDVLNSEFNPMHFGNMQWKPELIRVLPMTRDYFTAWTESNGNLEQTARRLVTPRRGGQPNKSQLGLQLPIRRIHPQLIRAKG